MSQYLAGQPGPPVSELPLLIQRSRGDVSSYLTRVRTRQRRMLTLAVVAGALATAFAATPVSNNLEENVARAETVRARLDILNIGLISGNLSQEQAASEYGECLQLASFL